VLRDSQQSCELTYYSALITQSAVTSLYPFPIRLSRLSIAQSYNLVNNAETPTTGLVGASIALPSLGSMVQTLESSCILFNDWFDRRNRTQMGDRRTDFHRQTQTDRSLCCVLSQRQVPCARLPRIRNVYIHKPECTLFGPMLLRNHA
jgi:hypothetical protein